MMATPRFFVEGLRARGDAIALTGSDAHKIVNVLRLQSGDAIEIVDSGSQRFPATLHVHGRDVRAELQEPQSRSSAPFLNVTVAQAVPKGQKMDFVVEKLSELGAHAIVPMYCERSVVTGAGEAKLDRWRRLARAAAQQSGRDDVLAIEPPCRFDELMQRFPAFDRVLMPWELAGAAPLRDRLPAIVGDARTVLVIVGPEGGFSHDEAHAAHDAGAHLFSLGKRILRTETAALVVVALLEFVTGG